MAVTSVYRLYDKDERLLYVGCAGNPIARAAFHAGEKPWWTDVVRIELSHYSSHRAARAVEAWAIRHEKPVWNVVRPNTPAEPKPRQARGICPVCGGSMWKSAQQCRKCWAISRQRQAREPVELDIYQ